MEHQRFDDFGKLVIENVRDRTLLEWDWTITGARKDKQIAPLASEIATFTPSQIELIRKLGSKIIDATIHNFLFVLEEYDWIHVSLETKDGKIISDIREVAAGDLQGYIFIWADQFSTYPPSR